MKRLTIAVLLLLGVFGPACGEPDPDMAQGIASKEPSPASAPTSDSWTIAMLQDGLFALPNPYPSTALLTQDLPVALTDIRLNMPRVGTYAGYSREAGETWAYAVQFAPGDAQEPRATLVRTALSDGRHEKIFEFRSTSVSFDGVYSSPSAAVSPDGATIAYTDVDGLKFFDVASQSSMLLAEDACPTGVHYEKGCNSFTDPRWSPDGAKLLVTKQLWEGSYAVSVDVATHDVRVLEAVGGDVMSWAPDGQTFCAHTRTYIPGGIFIVSSDGTTKADLSPTIEGMPHGCAFAADGRLAIAAAREIMPRLDSNVTASQTQISLRAPPAYDAALETMTLPLEQAWSELVGWNPGDTGVLLRYFAACEPTACEPEMPISGVWTPTSYEGFNFNPAAVFAVIPPP